MRQIKMRAAEWALVAAVLTAQAAALLWIFCS